MTEETSELPSGFVSSDGANTLVRGSIEPRATAHKSARHYDLFTPSHLRLSQLSLPRRLLEKKT